MKIKAVIDTNIFVSGLILKSGNSYKILELWRKNKFVVITSKLIIQEITKVLNYPKFQKKYYIEEQDIQEILGLLNTEALLANTEKLNLKIELSRDSTDNKFLVCAKAGQADFIVTGDNDLLVLNDLEGIPIITPAKFVKKFDM